MLDLCGGTGSWSAPYVAAGYDVVLIDPAGDELPGVETIRADVRTWELPRAWRPAGVLAAPPCTDLAGSGARWWAAKGPDALLTALAIADACVRLAVLSRAEWWALGSRRPSGPRSSRSTGRLSGGWAPRPTGPGSAR